MSTGPYFEVSAEAAPVDEPLAIIVCGLRPGAPVTLAATTGDDFDRVWRSHASFIADATGIVDLSTQPSTSGTYEGVDPMGLFWSMAPAEAAGVRLAFAWRTPAPISVLLTAESDGATAEATVVRTFMAPGVTRTVVREAGISGAFFAPAGEARQPGVIVLSGSAGGAPETRAAMLASHGFAALALAYFAHEGVPGQLANIPLDYFEAALDWMGQHPRVRSAGLAVVGTSRGGELALLLGTMFPQIKAVVAYAPSALTWGGAWERRADPAWTWRGQAVDTIVRGADRDTPGGAPVELRGLFLEAMEDGEAVRRATIPVERINGLVLLISGDDDRMWPSSLFCEMVMERLARFNHPHRRLHLCYEGAGHLIMFAYLPPAVGASRRPTDGRPLAIGGSPKAHALADADSWPRVLSFLNESLSRGDVSS